MGTKTFLSADRSLRIGVVAWSVKRLGTLHQIMFRMPEDNTFTIGTAHAINPT